MPLHQNKYVDLTRLSSFDYQSKCHCTKTPDYKDKVQEHEKQTAQLLSKHGFHCIFRKDVLENVDGKGRNVGLADLKNGIELKTLYWKIDENTIETAIRDTNKKGN